MNTSHSDRRRRLRTASLCAFALLMLAVRTEAAVAVESFSGGIVHQASAGSVLTWYHAVGASGTDHLLVAIVLVSLPSPCNVLPAVTSVTYGGRPMRLSGEAHNCIGLWMFHLPGPPAGKHEIVVNLNTPADAFAGSYSFSGVDQASPLRSGGGMRTCGGAEYCTSIAQSIPGGYFVTALGYVNPACFGQQSAQPTHADFKSDSPFVVFNAIPSNLNSMPDEMTFLCVMPSGSNGQFVLGALGINPTTPITASIAGHVANSDKQPQEGVRIDLQGKSPWTGESVSQSKTTDSTGAFSFPGLSRNWSYTLTPQQVRMRFSPADARVASLGADQAVDFVALSSSAPARPFPGPPLSLWNPQPNPKLKGQLGRLVIPFPHGVNVSGTTVQVFPADGSQPLHSGIGALAQTLPAGAYDVVISHVRIPKVPIQVATDTQMKVGVLRVSVSNLTRFFVLSEDQKQQLVNSYGKQAIGLPIGNYYVRIGNELKPVTISDGQITDY